MSKFTPETLIVSNVLNKSATEIQSVATLSTIYIEQNGDWIDTRLNGLGAMMFDSKTKNIEFSCVHPVTKQSCFKTSKISDFLMQTEDFCSFEAVDYNYLVGFSFQNATEAKDFKTKTEAILKISNLQKSAAAKKRPQMKTPSEPKATKQEEQPPHSPSPSSAKEGQHWNLLTVFDTTRKRIMSKLGRNSAALEEEKRKAEARKTVKVGAVKKFVHVAHLGYNESEGFTSIPNEWKELFQKAGITEDELKDKDTAKFVMKSISILGATLTPNLVDTKTGSSVSSETAPTTGSQKSFRSFSSLHREYAYSHQKVDSEVEVKTNGMMSVIDDFYDKSDNTTTTNKPTQKVETVIDSSNGELTIAIPDAPPAPEFIPGEATISIKRRYTEKQEPTTVGASETKTTTTSSEDINVDAGDLLSQIQKAKLKKVTTIVPEVSKMNDSQKNSLAHSLAILIEERRELLKSGKEDKSDAEESDEDW